MGSKEFVSRLAGGGGLTDRAPTFHGLVYYLMMDNPRTAIDEAHQLRPYYELHLWVHRENPIAVYSEWTPDVTCEHHQPQATGAGAHPPTL